MPNRDIVIVQKSDNYRTYIFFKKQQQHIFGILIPMRIFKTITITVTGQNNNNELSIKSKNTWISSPSTKAILCMIFDEITLYGKYHNVIWLKPQCFELDSRCRPMCHLDIQSRFGCFNKNKPQCQLDLMRVKYGFL